MNFSLFIGTQYMPIFYSLERYLKYIFYEKLYLNQSLLENEFKNLHLIITINEPKDLTLCCQWIYANRISPNKFRILGNDENNDINLLAFSTIKEQFENSFKIEQGINKLQIPFFCDQIKLFFKGHGEQSLLKCLSDANYYLNNYKNLLLIGDFAPNELLKNFLLPGVESWNQFIKRFQKYAPLLWVNGWIAETETIESSIIIISNDLSKINALESFIIFEFKTLQLISEIITIMEELASQTD